MAKTLLKEKKKKEEKDAYSFMNPEDILELEKMLEQREELEEAFKEYTLLDKKIKDIVKGKTLIVGSWMISGKWVERKGFEVKPMRYWEARIFNLEKEKK